MHLILLKSIGIIVAEELIKVVQVLVIPHDSQIGRRRRFAIINDILRLELFAVGGKSGRRLEFATHVAGARFQLAPPKFAGLIALLDFSVLSPNPKIPYQWNGIEKNGIANEEWV